MSFLSFTNPLRKTVNKVNAVFSGIEGMSDVTSDSDMTATDETAYEDVFDDSTDARKVEIVGRSGGVKIPKMPARPKPGLNL